MSSVLIVESKNDKIFVEALIEHLNLQNIDLEKPICQVDDYECLEGLNSKKLKTALTFLKNSLAKDDIQAIGIILDDDGRRAERIDLINEAVKQVFETDEQFSDAGEQLALTVDVGGEDVTLQLAYFLTNVDGVGELETLLKALKSKPSPYADCLENWRRCLEEENETVSDKEFDKFWLSNYIRFDTCSKKERKQARKKCSMQNFEYVMRRKKEIWDFDHPALDDFKNFLRLFEP